MKDIVGSDRRAIVKAATLLSGDPTTMEELLKLLEVEDRLSRHSKHCSVIQRQCPDGVTPSGAKPPMRLNG
ncbi:hypothetical protein [Myxococcus vastator]|uniref:hypothetical protein n=1 Tax=Myxococcus vastator TaxID=2709664 RepID=UPI001F07D8B0|nr:hypothetical protein [Myxococcus vastator]